MTSFCVSTSLVCVLYVASFANAVMCSVGGSVMFVRIWSVRGPSVRVEVVSIE